MKVDVSTTPTSVEVEMPAIDVSRPGVIATPQEETTWSEPLAVQAMVSVVGRTKEDTAEVSLEVMVIEQGPASALPTPSAIGETVPMEVSWWEGLAAPRSGEESSQALARAGGGQDAWGNPN
jgi:hypothetical protein